MIVDGDEPDTEKREDLFDIFTGVQIIAAKSRQILDHNAVGSARFYILDHLLKAGSLKG